MKEWLERVKVSLDLAQEAIDSAGDIPRENMYMLAPHFYSQVNHMNNAALLDEMSRVNQAQYEQDCATTRDQGTGIDFIMCHRFCIATSCLSKDYFDA